MFCVAHLRVDRKRSFCHASGHFLWTRFCFYALCFFAKLCASAKLHKSPERCVLVCFRTTSTVKPRERLWCVDRMGKEDMDGDMDGQNNRMSWSGLCESVCVRECVRACVYACVIVYACMRVWLFVCMRECVCMCACMGVGGCVCLCFRACVRACVRACLHPWLRDFYRFSQA